MFSNARTERGGCNKDEAIWKSKHGHFSLPSASSSAAILDIAEKVRILCIQLILGQIR